MSEGKFSQPRPHRDEERQIEESFRLLTEEKNRHRKKTYKVEEDIQKTVREISAQEVSLPEDTGLPFERSAKLEQTIQTAPGQTYVPKPQPRQNPIPKQPVRKTEPEPADRLFQDDFLPPKPVFQEPPLFTEEAPPEEPDFIDNLMHFGDFFRKHQTPVILGLCGAAVLLIVLFVSIFFAGGRNSEATALAGNVSIAGVNIGGLGTPIASLASLITLKLYMRWPGAKTGRFMAVFTAVNLVGLVILLAFQFLI